MVALRTYLISLVAGLFAGVAYPMMAERALKLEVGNRYLYGMRYSIVKSEEIANHRVIGNFGQETGRTFAITIERPTRLFGCIKVKEVYDLQVTISELRNQHGITIDTEVQNVGAPYYKWC